MKRIMTLVVIAMLACIVSPVRAQSAVTLITMHPMTTDVRSALESWLAVSAPVDTPYYAETYIEQSGVDHFVSLAALNISTADEEWHLTEIDDTPTKVLWIGSVRVKMNGIIEPLFDPVVSSGGHTARPRMAGGGSYVMFPFDAGTFVIYGPLGIHGSGEYGTSGMVAVDLVSGDDYGGSAASDAVYASVAGTVDYVCDDGTAVAIRTHNGTTGDYFLYVHLLDNANLTMSHEFEQAEFIGTVKHGTFNDDCGGATQKSNHWHVHWMFTPSNGAFQAEDCILTVSSQKWSCGTRTVGVGGALYGGGGSSSPESSGSGENDPGGTAGNPGGTGSSNRETTFFDYFLVGMASLWDRTILQALPKHGTSLLTFFSILINAVRLALRIAYVVVHFNINLFPLMFVLITALAFKAVFGVIWLIAAILRAWKSLVPIIGA